ncbi:MAG TPA: DUF6232 family protein [Micromonosporaceae bacterium]|jgi:hypothetical protein|nr:DUF6232 family protein [Micromonosporaceae bacterium]
MIQGSPSEPRARTFYVTDDVVVTETWLVVGRRRMLISELHNPQVSQARASRVPAALGVAAAIIPALAAATQVGTLTGWVAIILGVSLVLGVAVWLRATEVTHLVLCADYQGTPAAPVFWSRDPRVFGQVTRAVLRAREAAGQVRKASDIPINLSRNGHRSRRQMV